MEFITLLSSLIILTTSIVDAIAKRSGSKPPMNPNTTINESSVQTVIQNSNKGVIFRNAISFLALMIATGNIGYIMFGSPSNVPLTGETGAILIYSLMLFYASFSLRRSA